MMSGGIGGVGRNSRRRPWVLQMTVGARWLHRVDGSWANRSHVESNHENTMQAHEPHEQPGLVFGAEGAPAWVKVVHWFDQRTSAEYVR